MMFFAVIDTNVLVSAMLHRESVPGTILNHALEGDIIPLVSPEIINEYNDVLHRPKFKFDESAVKILMNGLESRALHFKENPLDEYFADPKDAVFYEIVMGARKEHDAYLVTGNIKHFPIKSFIVTPREMLYIIENTYTIE